jgi:hypothetical protein
VDSLWTPHGGGLEWMRTRDGLGMDWTRSGRTTGGLQQDSMSIGGLHVDSHRIPGGVKYTAKRGHVFGRVHHKNATQQIGSGHGSGNVQAQECVREGSCDCNGRYTSEILRKIGAYPGQP